MSANAEIVTLFAVLAGVLAIASAVGFVLKRRAGGSSATVDNLVDRVNAWWVMVAVMALAFLSGKTGLVLLFALASFAALREYLTLAPTRRGDHWALVAAFYLVLPVQYWLVATEWYGLFSVFIPVYVFLALPVLVAVRGEVAGFMGRVAEIQWGLMICVFCLSHVPALAMLPIPGYEGRGLMLIAFLVLVVQASDVLQYIWGKLTGRHKVAPKLSPSKTWEGLIGGIASATLLGALLHAITPFTVLEAAGLALVITLCGFFGGLVMSAIKRDRGVKDWGRMIAGHGGVLDRMDSVVFAAPVFFHLVRYWWTP
jgi:phosphatidate cytidylyltransferase